MRLQIRNRGTAALSALTLVAATTVALVGLTGTAQAATFVAQSPAINGAPVNQAGISSWGNATNPDSEITLTAVRNGSDIDFTVSGDTGPSTAAFAPFAANTYQIQAFVRLDGTANTRGTQFAGPTGTFDVPVSTSTYASGFTISGTFPGVSADDHTVTLTDLMLNSNGPSSGNDFGTPTGFDAYYNAGQTNAANVVAGVDWPLVEIVEGLPSPELSLTKTATTANFSAPGDVIDYEFEVENTGEVDVTGLAIVDDLIDSPATCESTSINTGATVLCTGSYIVVDADVTAGEVVNTATATGDGGVESAQSTATVEIAKASLALTKNAVTPNFSAEGDTIDYTFEVENTGDLDLTNVAIVDDLIDAPAVCDATSLSPQEATTCTGSHAVTADEVTAGEVVNTATATADGGVESAPSTATVGVVSPALSLEKSTDALPFIDGDSIEYTFTLTNSGNTELQAPFAVQDDLLDAPAVCDATETLAIGAALECAGTLTADALDVAAGSIVNTATATATYNETEVPSEEAEETIEAADPVLTLTKNATTLLFSKVGDVIDYTLTLKNEGNVELAGPFAVDDPLTSNEVCLDEVTTLAVDATLVCTASYTVTADDIAAGEVTNTATASGTFRGESVPSDPSSVTVLFSELEPGIALTGSADPTRFSAAGQAIAFTFTVENTGEAPLDGVSVEASKADGDVTCVDAALDAGGTTTCSATYTATAADVTAATIVNTATASASYLTSDEGLPVTGAALVRAASQTIESEPTSVTVNFQEEGPDANPKVTETIPALYCDTTGGIVASTGAIVPIENAEVTLEVSPAAAPPGDFVNVSVSLSKSAINGPTTLDPEKTRFEATVLVEGQEIDLIGPTNNASVAPNQPVFAASELPLVATGTIEVPAEEGLVEVVLKDFWFNGLKDDVSGGGAARTGIFDLVCNTTAVDPQLSDTPIGTTVTFLSDAEAPPTGVVPTTPAPLPTTPVDGGDTSGGTLPQTGGAGTIPALLTALVLFQIGLILAVRSVRTRPRHGAHAAA